MTVPALRIVAWSAALLGVGVVIVLVRTPPNVAPDSPPAVEATGVADDADARIEPSDHTLATDPLDLNFRQPVPAGLNRYGTPVMVGYGAKPPDKTSE